MMVRNHCCPQNFQDTSFNHILENSNKERIRNHTNHLIRVWSIYCLNFNLFFETNGVKLFAFRFVNFMKINRNQLLIIKKKGHRVRAFLYLTRFCVRNEF